MDRLKYILRSVEFEAWVCFLSGGLSHSLGAQDGRRLDIVNY